MTAQIPKNHLTRTRIFHITALENLPSILELDQLYAPNFLPCDPCSIANEEIQEKRATRSVSLPPYGCLHDYVPFYFAPRSPMLLSNHTRQIPNARPQKEILHLVTTAQEVAKAGLPFVFYDRHAVKAIAQAYNDLHYLDEIDWELFFEHPLLGEYSKFWQDNPKGSNPKWISRKEVRMAEFLVHKQLDWQLIRGVATMTKEMAGQVKEILEHFGQKTSVAVKNEWYY